MQATPRTCIKCGVPFPRSSGRGRPPTTCTACKLAAAPGTSRRKKHETATLDRSIYALAEEHQPCTVRFLYYLGIGRYWEKDAGGTGGRNYNVVIDRVGKMRERDELPWEWITDLTRVTTIPVMYDSPEEGIDALARHYRQDPWTDQPWAVQVWVESDSIKSVVGGVCDQYGVPLRACRGQSSKTFTYEATTDYINTDKKTALLYIGDFDPTGLQIPISLMDRIARYTDGAAEVYDYRLAVTDEDAASGRYVSHDANPKDPNYRRYVAKCAELGIDPATSAVETEAIPPNELRQRLTNAIEYLIDDRPAWEAAKVATETARWELRERLSLGRNWVLPD